MQTTRYWIGVDLHSEVIQACVLDDDGERRFERRYHGRSHEAGVMAVRELAEQFPGACLAVEALGSTRWFVAACRQHGLLPTVAHGASLQLKKSGRKTDRRDAYELARRLRLGDIERQAKAYHAADDEYGWRQLLRRRHRLVQMRTNVATQLRAMLRAHRAPQPNGDLYSRVNLERLGDVRLDNHDEQAAFDALVVAFRGIHEAIHTLEARIAQLVRKDERIAPLLLLPYVGPITAATLVAELGDVSRFKNAKTVASYAGMVPQVVQSGDGGHNGRLVRHGSRELRYVLGEWAVQLQSRHPVVKAWAAPFLARMPKNKVRIALARKLLVGVWHTLRTGEAFSLQRCLTTA